jgi:hypothetical protein
VLVDGHVLSDLAEPAERDDPERCHRRSLRTAPPDDPGVLFDCGEETEAAEAVADGCGLVLVRLDER